MSVAGPSCTSSGSMMTNYARMGHAVQQLFPEVLQDIIMIKEPQHRLHADVCTNTFLNRNLRADEWLMINNARTTGYGNFDIPLIYKLVRNLNLIPNPTQGWDSTPPTSTEVTPGDDIERIRRTRNMILHRGNSNVTDLELADFFCMSKDIASRLESYLSKHAGEYVNKFKNLETCCMDEKTEKLYRDRLDDLKKKDADLSKVVAEIKLEVDSLMKKDFYQNVIEIWEEENKLFIKTDAVDFVLTSLENKHICTVTGFPGVGKSATAHHTALFLRDTQGYLISPCRTPSDIEKYFRKNKKIVFVIDDVCGNYTAIQNQIEDWISRMETIKHIFQEGKVKLIVATCRLQVYRDLQFQRLKLLTEQICDLSSGRFSISHENKMQIAYQYLPDTIVEKIKDELDDFEFLPLMFTVYKSVPDSNVDDPLIFFKHPIEMYEQELNRLSEVKDKTKYCALFLLVVYDRCIDTCIFTDEESQDKRNRRECIFEDCGIPRNTVRKDVLEALDSLSGLFVQKTNNSNKYTTTHDNTFDFLCFYFGKKLQRTFIRFADINVLHYRTQLKSLNKNVDQFTIEIEEVNENEYFKRIIDESCLADESFLYNKQMKYDTYRNKLIEYMQHLSNSKIIQFVTAPKEVTYDYTMDKCTGSLPSLDLIIAVEIGHVDVLQFLLKFIDCTNDKTLSILLLHACSAAAAAADDDVIIPVTTTCNNNLHIVKLLIDKGAKVNTVEKFGTTPLMEAIEHGNLHIVKLLIDEGAKVNTVEKFERTPLRAAIEHGNLHIVRLLTEKGADVTAVDDNENTPLTAACEHNNIDIVTLLIEKGAKVNTVDEFDKSLLMIAYEKNNIEIAKLLIDKGAEINTVDNGGNTFLMMAMNDKNLDFVKLLIDKGSEVNTVNHFGRTPLWKAIRQNSYEIVKLLIDKGAYVYTLNNFGYTPLEFACSSHCNLDIVKLLIDKGAKVYNKENLNTSLVLACKRNIFDVVELLLNKGADINAEVNSMNYSGNTHLMSPFTNRNIVINEILIDNGADVNTDLLKIFPLDFNLDLVKPFSDKEDMITIIYERKETPLQAVCNKDKIDIVKVLIDNGAEVKSVDERKITPLMVACDNNNIDMVKLLIENGAEVNSHDDKKNTPIINACYKDNIDIVKLLIDKGAEVNIVDKRKNTPLMVACDINNIDIVKLLIENGAEVNTHDEKKNTPIINACYKDNIDIVKLLIDKGAQVNIVAESKNTPLMMACYNNNIDLVTLLLDKGAKVNTVDYNGRTPLQAACYKNNFDIVKLLIDNGAEVNTVLGCGMTHLTIECAKNNQKIISKLKIDKTTFVETFYDNTETPVKDIFTKIRENGSVKIDNEEFLTVNDNRDTPLKAACDNNNLDIVKLLIGKDADVNIVDAFGRTPLTVACDNNNLDIVNSLIDNIANVQISDTYIHYRTPLTSLNTACVSYNLDIVKLLIDKGAVINTVDGFGRTPLMAACASNNLDIVKLLIENGADVITLDGFERTPLMMACARNSLPILHLLLNNTENLNIQDDNGNTALIISCKNEHADAVRLLLNKKANVHLKNHKGMTALFYACIHQNYDIVKLLVDERADVNVTDTSGKTPLTYVSEAGNSTILELLQRCPTESDSIACNAVKRKSDSDLLDTIHAKNRKPNS